MIDPGDDGAIKYLGINPERLVMEFLTGASGIFGPLLQSNKRLLNGFAFAGQTGLWSLIPHCFLSIPEIEAVLH